eukprot:TRINITY_DN10989_c0_g1_i1.p1 TRINITY_DN10989_c0_g1~~TRINITY_DN10989_c0_g1_i1.p1  ORF type:complete len:314 (+),score=41.91 TRINITY_DN10989_c0_g1_i1:69-944(+)
MSYPVQQLEIAATFPVAASRAPYLTASEDAAFPCSGLKADAMRQTPGCLELPPLKCAEVEGQEDQRSYNRSWSLSTASPRSEPSGSDEQSTRSASSSQASSLATTPRQSFSRCTPRGVADICGIWAETVDVRLLTCMLCLCGLVENESHEDPMLHPRHLETEMPEAVVRLVLRALEMLRKCKYSVEDVGVICAHATVYFRDAYNRRGDRMDWLELGNVLVLSLFLGHSYALDNVCPLHLWHSYLFNKYCTLADLDAAVVRILELRKWVLRVEEGELRRLHGELCQAAVAAR